MVPANWLMMMLLVALIMKVGMKVTRTTSCKYFVSYLENLDHDENDEIINWPMEDHCYEE
jgi:hypothetical protein